MRNMAKALLVCERIETTLAKAKALRMYFEPLVTIAKNDPDSIFAKRRIFAELRDEDLVAKLFGKIAPLYKGINGGYTRIMPFRLRKGDGAETAIIELTKRTISDEKLLGTDKLKALMKKAEEKPDKKGKKPKKASEAKEPKAEKKDTKRTKAATAAMEEETKKEKHFVEDPKKEKAKVEDKKVAEKGLFRRFNRKSG
jgi:large subunit ribosomal protein L17